MLLVCYYKQDIFYYYRFNSVVIKDNNRKVYQHNCKEKLKGEGLEVQKKVNVQLSLYPPKTSWY